ncbi:hypothetical protein SDC9_162732 [bioreactor metagenome]|uniref:Uncharacterized protein n=1 Tax=bioreactor metagenome TaxID=1076179 RepID=A0A645FN81_9ZZZZ
MIGGLVHVGGGGHMGDGRLGKLQVACRPGMHVFAIGLAAAAVQAHELDAQLVPEQRVAGMVQYGTGIEQAVGGRQRAPRLGEADDQPLFPVAVAFAAQDPGFGSDVGRQVDFAGAGDGRQQEQAAQGQVAEGVHGSDLRIRGRAWL